MLIEKPTCLTPSLSTGPKRLSWAGSRIYFQGVTLGKLSPPPSSEIPLKSAPSSFVCFFFLLNIPETQHIGTYKIFVRRNRKLLQTPAIRQAFPLNRPPAH